MNPLWSDVAVRVLLSSSVVLAQALLLNWLEVPFAAITLFAGLAAYGMAAGVSIAAIAVLSFGLVFFILIRPLPQDRYLLLSLASLAIVRSAVGSVERLGGQLGIPSSSVLIPAQRPMASMPYAILLFIVSLAVLVVARYTQIGVTIEVARIGAIDRQALSMVPFGSLALILLAIAVVLGSAAGAVQGAYVGWIDPDLFRIDQAITILVATLAVGRAPIRGAAFAILFFVFPDLFSSLLGYERTAMAHVREILWSAAIVVFAGRLVPRFGGDQWQQ